MKKNINWIYKVFLLSFILSMLFGGISSTIASRVNNILLTIIILAVITFGIIFDMIGVAVLTSNEANLHAKASQKIKGAKEAITLLKNATKVSSVCNDVVGDVCGIVSGTLGAVLTINIANFFDFNESITTILVTAVISMITVGFKAIFKGIATKNSDSIVLMVGKLKHLFKLK